MFNKERFHNELAMRLGYERIVNDRRILIYVEESEDPIVTLRVQGYDEISFRASDGSKVMDAHISPELRESINAVHQAYVATINSRFS